MKRMKQTVRQIPCACVSLCLLLATPALGEPQTPESEGTPLLAEGKWKGFYKPVRSDRNDATYIVKRDDSGTLQIEMRLHLEPRDKFIFTLSEIELDEDTLAFTFGEDKDTRECKLERKANARLEGECFYRSDPERAVRATIEMRPPPHEAGE